MYVLVMLREYLDEILDEVKTFDARAYDTKKRGTIALIDTKKSEIIGLIALTNMLDKVRTRELIADVDISFLEERKRSIFATYIYNDDITYKRVGELYGISVERVR